MLSPPAPASAPVSDIIDGGDKRHPCSSSPLEDSLASTIVPKPTAGQSSPSSGSCAPTMWSLSDFQLGPRIGTGSFGHLQLVREVKTKNMVVLKVMKKRRLVRFRMQRHIEHEIQIQGHLRHPNILRLFGFFWDASHIYLMLSHAPGGDLLRLLRRQPEGLEEACAARFVAQLVAAVAYCHSLHVIHRD